MPDPLSETVRLDARQGDHRCGREYGLRFADLDPVTVSELPADLTEPTS